MTGLRFCAHRGALVDGSARLPEDPGEYFSEAVRALCGCNRLRCSRCGAEVRFGPPELGLKEGSPADAATLHAAANWRELPFVVEKPRSSSIDGGVRLYACRCSLWQANRVDLLENEHESSDDPDLPWACAGHPTPKLPTTLGPLTLDGDWAGVVDAILGGTCPRPLLLKDGRKEGPSLWLGWLYAYLQPLPEADELSRAVATHAGDGDSGVVGAVLYFFSRFPRAAGVEAVLALPPDQVAVGHLIAESYVPTAWDVLVARLESRTGSPDAVDQRAVERVQEVMVTPLPSLSHADRGPTELVRPLYKSTRLDVVKNALERTEGTFDDPALRLWLADHIVAIDEAAPGRWKLVMTRLSDWYGKPELGHLILIAGTRLLQSRRVTPAELEAWIKWRRANHGWMDEAWIQPLQTMAEEQRQRGPAS